MELESVTALMSPPFRFCYYLPGVLRARAAAGGGVRVWRLMEKINSVPGTWYEISRTTAQLQYVIVGQKIHSCAEVEVKVP